MSSLTKRLAVVVSVCLLFGSAHAEDLPSDSVAFATHDDPAGHIGGGGGATETLPYVCKLATFAAPIQNGTQKQINFGGAISCTAVVTTLSISVKLYKLNDATLLFEEKASCSNTFHSVGFVNCSAVWPTAGTAPLIAAYRLNGTGTVRFPTLYSPPTANPSETSFWAF